MCLHVCELFKDTQSLETCVASRRQLEGWGIGIRGRLLYTAAVHCLWGKAPIFALSIIDKYVILLCMFATQFSLWATYLMEFDNIQKDLFPFLRLESASILLT